MSWSEGEIPVSKLSFSTQKSHPLVNVIKLRENTVKFRGKSAGLPLNIYIIMISLH